MQAFIKHDFHNNNVIMKSPNRGNFDGDILHIFIYVMCKTFEYLRTTGLILLRDVTFKKRY